MPKWQHLRLVIWVNVILCICRGRNKIYSFMHRLAFKLSIVRPTYSTPESVRYHHMHTHIINIYDPCIWK